MKYAKKISINGNGWEPISRSSFLRRGISNEVLSKTSSFQLDTGVPVTPGITRLSLMARCPDTTSFFTGLLRSLTPLRSNEKTIMRTHLPPLLIYLSVLFLFFACDKKNSFKYRTVNCDDETLHKTERTEHVGEAPQVAQYTPIWKSMFLEQNHLTEEFFNDHITVFQKDTFIYRNTTYLNVGAEYRSAWAAVNLYNQIIIRINNMQSPFYKTGLPVDADLTKEQIQQLSGIAGNLSGNSIARISTQTNLRYDYHTAKERIRKKLNLNKLCGCRCSINSKGHLTLSYHDFFFDKTTYCTSAEMDLITGEIEARVNECVIN